MRGRALRRRSRLAFLIFGPAMGDCGRKGERREDLRLLTGQGCFVDDLRLPRQAYAAFLRSPHANAIITSIDTAMARSTPRVLAVYTGDDVERWALGPLPCATTLSGRSGNWMWVPARPALAIGRVRHVGEPVAMVVATDSDAALDAMELIDVDYEPLPAVLDPLDAARSASARVHEERQDNLCAEWQNGDATRVEDAFAAAAHRVRIELRNNRLVASPIEPRAVVADCNSGSTRFTLYSASQGVHELQAQLARHVFRIPEERIRVVTSDVGGSFGLKMYLYPEHVMALAAARELGRPVKWTGSRSEAFLADNHSRDQVSVGELALDGEGNFLAMRFRAVAGMGAYLSGFGPAIPTEVGTPGLAGPYRTPAIHVAVQCVFTNTAPVDAYRGAGRPESTYVLERLIEKAAMRLGLDPVELRRRNLIRDEEIPYRTPLGHTYDSGAFRRNLDDVLLAADWSGFAERKAAAAERGLLAGIGLACFVEPAGGYRSQRVDLRFRPDGGLTLVSGSQSTGMGHETALTGIVTSELGLRDDAVQFVQGDTDSVPFGRWTSGSRTAVAAGTAVLICARRARDRLRALASVHLETDPADVTFAEDRFTVLGTDRHVSVSDLVKAVHAGPETAGRHDLALDQSLDFTPGEGTYPNGCHVCEIVIEPDTGQISVARYTAVDDFGRLLNASIVEGQLHGGLAQGIGQALYENCLYDPQSGQLLTGSFLDYPMPRAGDLPMFSGHCNEIACTTNPLGVKGCGEAGAIAAPPAVMNAVLNALAPLGVEDIAMPATPLAVWQAIRG